MRGMHFCIDMKFQTYLCRLFLHDVIESCILYRRLIGINAFNYIKILDIYPLEECLKFILENFIYTEILSHLNTESLSRYLCTSWFLYYEMHCVS